MDSSESDRHAFGDEKPLLQIRIAICASVYEMTQTLHKKVRHKNPSDNAAANKPVKTKS